MPSSCQVAGRSRALFAFPDQDSRLDLGISPSLLCIALSFGTCGARSCLRLVDEALRVGFRCLLRTRSSGKSLVDHLRRLLMEAISILLGLLANLVRRRLGSSKHRSNMLADAGKTAICKLVDGRLAVIDLLCSGFREIQDHENLSPQPRSRLVG